MAGMANSSCSDSETLAMALAIESRCRDHPPSSSWSAPSSAAAASAASFSGAAALGPLQQDGGDVVRDIAEDVGRGQHEIESVVERHQTRGAPDDPRDGLNGEGDER